jgi:FKBP-type peptidyl-prolyl cis-trans isomerase 2
MAQASSGDTVRVHYTGRLGDGEVFDSSLQREPLEFRVGGGQVIPGFEQAVTGMAPGEVKTVTIPAGEAYGERSDELYLKVERERLPEHLDPEVGQQLQMSQGGQVAMVTIAEVTDDAVTLDANHPLAGKELTFELELVEIV